MIYNEETIEELKEKFRNDHPDLIKELIKARSPFWKGDYGALIERIKQAGKIDASKNTAQAEIISLAKKRPPVIYTVSILQDWEGGLSVSVQDIQDDPRSRQGVADALRRATDSIEENIQ